MGGSYRRLLTRYYSGDDLKEDGSYVLQSGVVRVKIEGDNEPSPSVPRQVRILIGNNICYDSL